MTPDPVTWLADRGWDMSGVADKCWLDCPEPGYRKEFAVRGGGRTEIILCIADAVVLEEGVCEGDYIGASVPDDSRATSWPFMPVWAQAG
jgi:hypothetical protein